MLRSASEVAVNPFESGLRGLAIESTGPIWVPQSPLTLRSGRRLHPDAGCEELRIALEADSHESTRAARTWSVTVVATTR